MVIENTQLATLMYILFIFNNFNNMYEKYKIRYFVSLLIGLNSAYEFVMGINHNEV